MSDPPKEEGLYIIDFGDGLPLIVTVRLHGIYCDDDRKAFCWADWGDVKVAAYRRLTDEDLRETLHGPQQSGPPDRPGWWRCRIDDRDGWRCGVVEVEYYGDDESDKPVYCFVDRGSRLFVTDLGVSWYGRVRMPGEE